MFQNRKAFSMVEMLVVIALMSIAGIAVMSGLMNHMKASKHLDDSGKAREVQQALNLALSTTALCDAAIATPPIQNAAGPIRILAPPYDISTNAILDNAWQVVSSGFESVSTPLPPAGAVNYNTSLNVVLRKINTQTNLGPTQKTLSVPILVSTTPSTNLVSSCTGTGGAPMGGGGLTAVPTVTAPFSAVTNAGVGCSGGSAWMIPASQGFCFLTQVSSNNPPFSNGGSITIQNNGGVPTWQIRALKNCAFAVTVVATGRCVRYQ